MNRATRVTLGLACLLITASLMQATAVVDMDDANDAFSDAYELALPGVDVLTISVSAQAHDVGSSGTAPVIVLEDQEADTVLAVHGSAKTERLFVRDGNGATLATVTGALPRDAWRSVRLSVDAAQGTWALWSKGGTAAASGTFTPTNAPVRAWGQGTAGTPLDLADAASWSHGDGGELATFDTPSATGGWSAWTDGDPAAASIQWLGTGYHGDGHVELWGGPASAPEQRAGLVHEAPDDGFVVRLAFQTHHLIVANTQMALLAGLPDGPGSASAWAFTLQGAAGVNTLGIRGPGGVTAPVGPIMTAGLDLAWHVLEVRGDPVDGWSASLDGEPIELPPGILADPTTGTAVGELAIGDVLDDGRGLLRVDHVLVRPLGSAST